MTHAAGLLILLLGAPAGPPVVLDGAPHNGLSYMTYVPEAQNFRDMGEAGVHLYSFSATPTESTYSLAPLCWTASDTFDYANLDERARMVLESDPGGMFFPRLYLGTPPWWAEAHPDDVVQIDPGDGVPVVFTKLEGPERAQGVASWASEQWRNDTAEALRRLIRHVEASPYADRVVGYHIASGTTEEWMQWGSNEGQYADYSPVNTVRFRAWLTGKYGDDAGLQRAWNDPAVTLGTAAIPPRTFREASERGLLRDPARAQACIDYVLYNSWMTAETIRFFARVVKEATQDRALVGVFYGYVAQLAGEQREQNAGHLALHDVLACPDIDFVTSPSSYAFRELGTGFPHAMSLADSVKLHGKTWYNENDIRTWLTPGVPAGMFGKTATFEESLLAQRREFAWVLTNRHGMWWFDMGGGWYKDPRMLEAIGQMRRIADACLDVNGAPVAEIALVVDDKSSAYLRPDNPFTGEAVTLQLPRLGRAGAPFSMVHLADLPLLPEYRLYFFANCLAPDAKERAAIARIRAGGRASIVWIGPAGLYRDGQLDVKGMADLTGLPLELVPHDGSMRIEPTADAPAWGWRNPQTYGRADGLGHVALLAPTSELTVLGYLEGTDTPALVAGERVLWSATPSLPAGLIRAMAEKAGVHLYIDTEDIVWACEDLLAVSVNEGGPRTVRLPRDRTVTDLWTDGIVAGDTDHFGVDIPDRGTALFRMR